MPNLRPFPADHFGTAQQQAHAATFGMWVFLASEILLFAGMFTLYGAYRMVYFDGFVEGIDHNLQLLGSANTVVLLISSFCVAHSVADLRDGRLGLAKGMLTAAVVLGLAFMTFKGVEYADHFREGIFPGGRGAFFQDHTTAGLAQFFTLYYLMTGAHAIHVTIGIAVLAVMALRIHRGTLVPATFHQLEIGALYWHLVDLVWIVLWPLFYLTGTH